MTINFHMDVKTQKDMPISLLGDERTPKKRTMLFPFIQPLVWASQDPVTHSIRG